jgi:23S rRNA (guanosine2251-2'-O)-methyltransferase
MEKNETMYIFGKNAVLAALQNRPDIIERIFIEKDKGFEAGKLNDFEKKVEDIIKEKKIKKEIVSTGDLSREMQAANHQGILAKVRVDDLTVNFEYFIENLEIDSNTCLVLLGELQDVQNVGSIIRSATAFGVAGILIPEHDQAQVNGTVVKVSAGTAFNIPLVKINNVNNCIEKLKEKRFWVYGLDVSGEKTIYEEDFTEATCFVIGNEGDGIRAKTKEACDMLLNIPISQNVESLNASISTAITLYEWRKQKLTK